MAQPKTIKFGKLKIEIGDGATPEVFTAPCGFTEKSFSRSKALNEVLIPDCDDPDAPVVVATDVASITFAVSGQGVLAGESVATWDAFFSSTTSRNIKVTMEFDAPVGTIIYAGKAHLESFEVTGQVGNRVTANVSLRGDGALTRTPALS
jgi:hypothetical protein